MFSVEFCQAFRCVDIRCVLPGIVFRAVAFPFDEEPQSSVEHLTIQYFFNQVFFFSIYEFRWGWGFRMSTRNRVEGCGSEFHYIEDWVETSHGLWQFKAVCISGDLTFYLVGSQPTVGELSRRPGRADVGSVKINFVARLVLWCRKPSLVVVPSHVILSFV